MPAGAAPSTTRFNRKFLDDEAFGAFFAPMRPGSFEFLCRSCISAPTLAEALSRAGRFLRIVLPDLAVSIRRHHNHAELIIHETRRLAERPDDHLAGCSPALEWLRRLIHGLACWLAGRGIGLDGTA
ncbi:MAG: AraC family transcriptional regulator ligand-binding domain-containing protein [Marinagarivorans sp.]|nr:AraC family transcriptional regulator ligand-binding domain-containing protein [Marinagarivorans sp.]